MLWWEVEEVETEEGKEDSDSWSVEKPAPLLHIYQQNAQM
jgi:hypothetical protein